RRLRRAARALVARPRRQRCAHRGAVYLGSLGDGVPSTGVRAGSRLAAPARPEPQRPLLSRSTAERALPRVARPKRNSLRRARRHRHRLFGPRGAEADGKAASLPPPEGDALPLARVPVGGRAPAHCTPPGIGPLLWIPSSRAPSASALAASASGCSARSLPHVTRRPRGTRLAAQGLARCASPNRTVCARRSVLRDGPRRRREQYRACVLERALDRRLRAGDGPLLRAGVSVVGNGTPAARRLRELHVRELPLRDHDCLSGLALSPQKRALLLHS